MRFLIDPQHVSQALTEGKCLMVEVYGHNRKVTVVSRKDYPGMFPPEKRV